MYRKIILLCTLVFVNSLAVAEESKDTHSTKTTLKKKKTLSEKKLVVFVSNGDLEVAGMGFGIALSAVKQGADVTIVIGANALKYALKDGEQNVYFAKERTPRALLEEALKSGASIQLCSANTNVMGMDEDDFIDGAKEVISTEIFAKVFASEAKVISF